MWNSDAQERIMLRRESVFHERLAAARARARADGTVFSFEQEIDLRNAVLAEFPLPGETSADEPTPPNPGQ